MEAVRLSGALRQVKRALESGARDFEAQLAAASDDLARHGWRVEYVALRRRERLAPHAPGDRELVVLAAGWLGKTRLIDNFEVTLPGTS